MSGDSAMLTTHPSSVVQKRDLHVGGLGSSASGALAAVTDPVADLADSWFDRAWNAAQAAEDYVHEKPWAALAVAAMVGLAAGFLLS
jgi:ElaB protein